MTILPLHPAQNASPEALRSFLEQCRAMAARDKHAKLVSISLAVEALDPLAVLESIFEPGEPHFYAERPSIQSAVAGAEVAAEEGFRYSLLAESQTGYQNLCRLITKIKMRTGHGDQELAVATREDIAEHAEGLICLTGGDEGPLAWGLSGAGRGAADNFSRQSLREGQKGTGRSVHARACAQVRGRVDGDREVSPLFSSPPFSNGSPAFSACFSISPSAEQRSSSGLSCKRTNSAPFSAERLGQSLPFPCCRRSSSSLRFSQFFITSESCSLSCVFSRAA